MSQIGKKESPIKEEDNNFQVEFESYIWKDGIIYWIIKIKNEEAGVKKELRVPETADPDKVIQETISEMKEEIRDRKIDSIFKS